MRTLIVSLCAVMLMAGCAPTTQLISDGHYNIQLTQSKNFWGQNVTHVTRCAKSDMKDGFCAPQDTRQYEQTEIAAAPGPEIVKAAVIGASILGGTALLMHGYRNQNVSQPNRGAMEGSSISTINMCGTGPAFPGMSPAPGCR